MSSKIPQKINYHYTTTFGAGGEEISIDDYEKNIKLIRRTIENNTHVVIEDTKIKNITSWRKSKKKFF